MPRDTVVLVPAAGRGERLGPGAPKALRALRGDPLLLHAVRRIAAAESVAAIVVAAPPGAERAVRDLLASVVGAAELVVVTGGASREESVARALAAAPPDPQVVLVHDAARCLCPPELADEVAAAVRGGHDAVVPVLPVTDTVKQVDGGGAVVATPDRATLRAVQTPQGFRREVLVRAYAAVAAGETWTDDASLVARYGAAVHTIPGREEAMKVTRPFDLLVAEAVLDRA
ncbi:MAG TPA: 2-C-methyl-D-erythritol 4-phosphate cytidylyltransferase [Mycobacteriales bacterium]|nr:2-C-methyl-D-erythritol 4-phosphate cytidylyltransferase [Cryptosporangiaceae bacterium]MDQ1674962.1 2-C-methyl-D-erythritol 4-phosphate cytidylyltransferase [Actinomycetota bacterium]HEV7757117.1 2-C-methyl-D-erythritol 4-phosphate cytidylyltransferase [Mycobacteriales bacterium]